MIQTLVGVASFNPVKIECTDLAFQAVFPRRHFHVFGCETDSGVSKQPMTNEETKTGAYNRAENLQKLFPDAKFWLGIEGGLQETSNSLEAFAWVVIKSDSGKVSWSRTASFFLPPKIAELVHQGMELGEADDLVFGRSNSKQANGSVGILTNDVITRTTFYYQAVVLALIPFLKPELY